MQLVECPVPKSREKMPQGCAGPAGWFFVILAVLATAGAVWLAVLDVGAHADVLRFDSAPVCKTPAPSTATSDCKTELRATVVSIKVLRGRPPRPAIFTFRASGNFIVTAEIEGISAPDVDEEVDVVLWRGKCVIVRAGEGSIATLDSPAWHQRSYAYGVLPVLGFAVLFESVAAVFFLYFAVTRERLVAAFLVAAVLLVGAGLLRIAHAYDAVVVATVVVPVLVAGLYGVWPRLGWAREQAETQT